MDPMLLRRLNRSNCDSMCRMDPASEALPDDVAALRAALVAERARGAWK